MAGFGNFRSKRLRSTRRNLSLLLEIDAGCQFLDSEKNELDLHWQIMRKCRNTDKTAHLWTDAVSVKLGSSPTLALSPTHQLFHICWHGAQYNPMPPIRWIADALMILKTSRKAIEWKKLVEMNDLHRVNLLIYSSLDYLNENFSASIPSEILDALKNAPASRMQKAANLSPMHDKPLPWNWRQFAAEYTFEF